MYNEEAERQLNNNDSYRKLQEDPTAINMKLVNDQVERFKKQDKTVAEGLKSRESKKCTCRESSSYIRLKVTIYKHSK